MPGDATGGPLKIVIVDDHATFSRGLQLLLDAAPGARVGVAATTDDAGRAADLVEEHAAEVALVDWQMPPPGGLHAIREIRERVPACTVLVLSGVEEPEVGIAALRAGAHGYLMKSAEPEELLPAIAAARSGIVVMPDWLCGRLLSGAASPRVDLSHLDEEERELLRLMCTGLETAEIAEAVHVSDRTAKRLIAGLLRHMGVATRLEAAILAAHAGLVPPPT